MMSPSPLPPSVQTPVHIDGSAGEGGGQVLRLSVALSAATGRPLRITGIRANRRSPGLRAQHVAAVDVVRRLTGASVEGLALGSSELTFAPTHPARGEVSVDVGTAGSVTLVLQAVLGALSAPGAGPAEVAVRGGTDVTMAPTWDYLVNVLVPTLGRAGLDLRVECERRGFYPVGGGRVVLRAGEVERPLDPFVPEPTGEPVVGGAVVWSGLSDDIPRRIDHAVRKELVGFPGIRLRKERVEADCPGVSATLWADTGGAVVGASMVGRRGLPSERIGKMLADELRADTSAGAAADAHLTDQLVVHAAMADGTSRLATRALTTHARTALDVASRFLPIDPREEVTDGLVDLSIMGRYIGPSAVPAARWG